jgi:DNA polymerase-3 subunit alpha
MVGLIKKHYKKDIDIYNLPLDDKKVYQMFKKGYNSDTFQFGTLGFTDYSKMLQPDNIHDLIAMVALFRPGVMGTGAHIDYVNLKHGRKEPEYDLLCEEITKETYGIMVYQEQLMFICQKVGGFDLQESDDIRKSTGKKIQSILDSYKPKFIKGAIKNGYTEDMAKKLWHKLEYAGSYLFNKSHATTYAITGYISMWFKANYPLEFWTAALEFVKNMEYVSRFINEMNKLQDVSIVPPDINYSDRHFVSDPKTKKIYWSLIQIKEVGEVATQMILEARETKGKFFFLE